MSIENNIPAFPVHEDLTSADHMKYKGMTLLDYFAAQAMNGLLSSSLMIGNQGQTYFQLSDAQKAGLAYEIATHMIEQRKTYFNE